MKIAWVMFLHIVLFTASLPQGFARPEEKPEQQSPEQQSKETEATVVTLQRRVRDLEELVRQLQVQMQTLREPHTSQASKSTQVSESSSKEASTGIKLVSAAPPPVKQDPGTLRAYWKEGIRLDSHDGSFKLKAGGRIQNDWGFFSGDRALEDRVGLLRDGTEFRRARFYVSGEIYDNVEFKAQYDFAGAGPAEFKDVYLGLKHLPGLGNLRVGHFKEPFSLDELTSSKYIMFLERSLPNLFAPGRNTGFMLHNTAAGQRVSWAAGVFRDTDSFGNRTEDGNLNYSGRFTGLPWYKDGGARLLHLGVAYSHRNPRGNLVRFRQRPEAHLLPRFVDTKNISAESLDLLGIEAAWVEGPVSVQSELIENFVDTPAGANPRFQSFYIQGSFFLTGEHRNYKKTAAAFDRLKPRAPFSDQEGGLGAWELAARYSYLDLRDKGFDGGKLEDFTFGVNWYLNPNTRVMWNYVYSDLQKTGQANIFQTRFQVDF